MKIVSIRWWGDIIPGSKFPEGIRTLLDTLGELNLLTCFSTELTDEDRLVSLDRSVWAAFKQGLVTRDEYSQFSRVYQDFICNYQFQNYCLLGEAATLLGMQTQYVYHYVRGLVGAPALAGDLRVIDDRGGNYHAVRIHNDDLGLLVDRVRQHRG